MNNRIAIARTALRGALELRRRAKILKNATICIYDVVEHLGIDVRFLSPSSFGGMYSKSTETILVPALRPPGRQAFTCAHELAHWFFGHGSRIDDINTMEANCNSDPEEQLANIFAGYFLATPWAVNSVFSDRNWNPERVGSLQIYTAAMQLGMGYMSLIQHLQGSLQLISAKHATELRKTTPKDIRASILKHLSSEHIVIADCAWKGVPIDLRVGDFVVLPPEASIEGKNIAIIDTLKLGLIAEARFPGISRAIVNHQSWASFIRVSRKGFEGRSIYRHMEDPDVN